MAELIVDDIVMEEEVNSGCCAVLKEEVRELKWAVLIVACFLTFGSYYVFDFPGSIGTGTGNTIEQQFVANGKTYTQGMNQFLYSVYSWPNTILAVFGGLLIDRFLGLRSSILLFASLIFIGMAIFAVGIHRTSFPVMVMGRIIFGLGGECLSVSQSAFVARWFRGGRGMALAFGITISFSRVGSSFNFLLSPTIAGKWGVNAATQAGLVACWISLVAALVLVSADAYAVRTGYIKPGASMPSGEVGDAENTSESAAMRLADVYTLPLAFWLLCVICVSCYTAIFPFIGISKNFFEVKYNYTDAAASMYVSSYQLTSAISSPLIGFVVDTLGRNCLWLLLASGAFIMIHILFTTTVIPAFYLMVDMGAVYGFLVSGLWPSVPLVVPQNMVAFSYGVMTAIQNVGLASFPIAVGAVLDHFRDAAKNDPADSSSMDNNSGLPPLQAYVWTEAMFIGAASVSLLASLTLLVYDLRQQRRLLSCSNSKRKQLMLEWASRGEFAGATVPESQRSLLHSQGGVSDSSPAY